MISQPHPHIDPIQSDAVTPPGAPHIRPLEASDSLEELTDLFHRAYAHLIARGLNYTAGIQDVETTRRRIDGAECFVVEDEGRLVGSITFRDAARSGGCPWYDRPDVATFQQLCVDPAYRGRGLAHALMDLAERRAAETGARELACDTAKPATDLVEMYTRRGYRIVGEADWEATNYESWILSKDVAGSASGI
jgi:GNAT superfamily N-acetyltransferase